MTRTMTRMRSPTRTQTWSTSSGVGTLGHRALTAGGSPGILGTCSAPSGGCAGSSCVPGGAWVAWPHWGTNAPSSVRPVWGLGVGWGRCPSPFPGVSPPLGLGDTLWAWLEDGPPHLLFSEGPIAAGLGWPGPWTWLSPPELLVWQRAGSPWARESFLKHLASQSASEGLAISLSPSRGGVRGSAPHAHPAGRSRDAWSVSFGTRHNPDVFNKSVVHPGLDVPYLLDILCLLHVDVNSGLRVQKPHCVQPGGLCLGVGDGGGRGRLFTA